MQAIKAKHQNRIDLTTTWIVQFCISLICTNCGAKQKQFKPNHPIFYQREALQQNKT